MLKHILLNTIYTLKHIYKMCPVTMSCIFMHFYVLHFQCPTVSLVSYVLWPPCVADADIIFLSCFLLLSSFFPHLI